MANRYTVDTHPKRDQIIKALVDGKATIYAIAKRFEINRTVLSRYVKERIAPKIAAAVEERERQAAESLVDRIEGMVGSMEGLLKTLQTDYTASRAAYEKAKTPEAAELAALGFDNRMFGIVARELREGFGLLSKVYGMVKDGGEINTYNLTVNENFTLVIQAIERATKNHPEIREKIIAEIGVNG